VPLAPPSHLERAEVAIWRSLVGGARFEDHASLALLQGALEAHQRAGRCREAVDAGGETVRDRFDQMKPHPLLAAERERVMPAAFEPEPISDVLGMPDIQPQPQHL